MGQPNPEAAGGEPIRLRAHHLLCILGSRGKGYNDAFIANMSCVVERIRSEPRTLLALVDSGDCICSACPHDSPEGCVRAGNTAGRVRERDTAVLLELGLCPSDLITVRAAYQRVKERITPACLSRIICLGCEWEPLGYCKEGLDKLQANGGAIPGDEIPSGHK